MSSAACGCAPPRVAGLTDGAGSSSVTDSACVPRRPSATLNSTRVPPLSVSTPSGRALACRNTSLPSSSEMKPKPFSASYHLTLPVGTVHLLLVWWPAGVVPGRGWMAQALRWRQGSPHARAHLAPVSPATGHGSENRCPAVGGRWEDRPVSEPPTPPLPVLVLARPAARGQVAAVDRGHRDPRHRAGRCRSTVVYLHEVRGFALERRRAAAGAAGPRRACSSSGPAAR